jgi:hypothetical protein
MKRMKGGGEGRRWWLNIVGGREKDGGDYSSGEESQSAKKKVCER